MPTAVESRLYRAGNSTRASSRGDYRTSELFSANNLQRLAAELIATFTFVFLGVGAICAAQSLVNPVDGAGLVIIALGHGLGIFLGIVVIGRITGAHLNPAVTITTIISGNIGLVRGLTYIVGQLAGAALAARWPSTSLSGVLAALAFTA